MTAFVGGGLRWDKLLEPHLGGSWVMVMELHTFIYPLYRYGG